MHSSASGELTPLGRTDRSYQELEERLTSLAATVSHWQRDLESSASRASRLEGAFSVLLTSLEGWKSDIREVASRTESRVLRGLEVLDSRIGRVQPGQDSTRLLASLERLEKSVSDRLDDLEQRLPAPDRSATVLEGLGALERRLVSIEERATTPVRDDQLAVRIAESFDSLSRRLRIIEDRVQSPAPTDERLAARIGEALEGLARRLEALEQRVAAPPRTDGELASRLNEGFEALGRRMQAIEQGAATPPPADDQLAARMAQGFEQLSRRLQALEDKPSPAQLPGGLTEGLKATASRLEAIEQKIEQKAAAPGGDDKLLARLAQAFETFNRRLQAIEQRPAATEEQVASRLQQIADALGGRLEALDRKAPATDPQLLGRLAEGFDAIGRRIESLAQRASTAEEVLPARLTEGLEAVVRRLQGIDQKIAEQDTMLGARVTETSRDLERRIAESNANLERRIAETQQGFQAGMDALRSGIARLADPAENRQLEAVTGGMKALESRLAESQEALTRKLDSVQAESDENNATQLRYLAGLEELQSAVAKRIQALEGLVSNPLDAQQWERLARGLEFLDSRLAQSADSIANRLDAAMAGLTATLDNRAATGQEANLKSAERLWRALRGLEDQITSSYQMVNQSQERLESAAQNLASSIEDLRAVSGARAGHTEKLLMEGLENLDQRFAQNLMAVSESLGGALFALNKATGEWRAELFNATEESEERLVGHIGQTEAKLAGDLKAGLDAIGRREERMLALILGGGPPLAGYPDPTASQKPEAGQPGASRGPSKIEPPRISPTPQAGEKAVPYDERPEGSLEEARPSPPPSSAPKRGRP